MKVKLTGLVLAVLAAVSVTLSAFATTAGIKADISASQTASEAGQNLPEASASAATPFCLEGVPLNMTYQVCQNTYYVTVASFMAAMDPEIMVEEEAARVTVTAATVSGVMDVYDSSSFFIPTGSTSAANVEESALNLTAKAGDRYAVANGRYLYVEDGVINLEGKVALPIRVLAKVFNLNVSYETATQRVCLTRQEGASAYLEDGETFYDADTLYWLSHIIYAESGNQPLTGKIAVGNVVMNRVASSQFPNTIYEVLFQRNQFSPAMSGSIYREPNAASVVAAKLVLDGAEALEDVLFFNRAGMNTRAARTRPFVATIGGHSFYA